MITINRRMKPSFLIVVDPDSLDGTQVRFWHHWRGEAASILEELTMKFNLENSYEVEVLIENKGSDLFGDVRQGLNTGQYPNIVMAPRQDLLAWQHTRDILVNLNDYISDPKQGLSGEDISEFEPLLWDQDDKNGIRLGLPGLATSSLLAYNATWARELGFDSSPDTPAAFTNQACAAAAASIRGTDVDGRGGFISRLDPAGVMSWIMAFDGEVITEAGEDYAFNSPEVIFAYDYLKSLFKGGCAWKPGEPYAEDEFAARRGLLFATSVLELPYIEAAFTNYEATDEWTVIPYPTQDGAGVINLSVYSYAILESVPEEQFAAWLYLKWMIAPENMAALVKASSTYPVRISAKMYLDDYTGEHLPWAEAQELFSLGLFEPQLGSWKFGRWAVRESAEELISPDFNSDEIPYLLKKLDTLLAEIQMQNP